MARKIRRKLGEILVQWGVLSPAAVNEALQHAQQQGVRLGEALVELGLADEEDVTKALASQFNMEYIDLDHNAVAPSEMHLIPEDVIRKHLVLPVSREDNHLKVIVTDPLDLGTLDVLRKCIRDAGASFKLVFFRPPTGVNPNLQNKCEANRFTVIRQLAYSVKDKDKQHRGGTHHRLSIDLGRALLRLFDPRQNRIA